MRFILIFIFIAFPCLDTYGITKVYNIIDRKLKIHTLDSLTVEQKRAIKSKIDQISDALNEYDSSSFNNFFIEISFSIYFELVTSIFAFLTFIKLKFAYSQTITSLFSCH